MRPRFVRSGLTVSAVGHMIEDWNRYDPSKDRYGDPRLREAMASEANSCDHQNQPDTEFKQSTAEHSRPISFKLRTAAQFNAVLMRIGF